MELSRLARVLRARWWALALVAGIAVVPAVVLTSIRNNQIEDLFQSTILLTFPRDDTDRTGSLLEGVVNEADDLAHEGNAELLEADGRLSIEPDTQAGQLRFSARAGTEAEAEQLVQQLYDNFVGQEESQLGGSSAAWQAELDRLAEEIARTSGELALVEAELVEDQSTATRRAILDIQIAQLENEVANLTVELVVGTERTTEEVQTDLDNVQEELGRLQAERAALPVAASRSPVTLRKAALESKYNDLLTRYQNLFINPPSVVEADVTSNSEDLTPANASMWGNGLLGALAGALLGLAVVVVHDRSRRPVWLGHDLVSAPLLAEVPSRELSLAASQVWYQVAGSSQRKQAVQALRAVVEGTGGAAQASYAVVGLGASARDIHQLAADFAMSLVTAGRRVLLIDADFSNPSDLGEFSGSGPTLSELISLRTLDGAELEQEFKNALTEHPEVVPGLTALRAGTGLEDPADAVAGKLPAQLIGVASKLFDTVILTAGGIADAAAQTLLHHSDHVIVGLRAGRVPADEVETIYRQLSLRGVKVLGVVLLTKTARQPRVPMIEPPVLPRRSEPAPAPAPRPSPSPVVIPTRDPSAPVGRRARPAPEEPAPAEPVTAASPVIDTGGPLPVLAALVPDLELDDDVLPDFLHDRIVSLLATGSVQGFVPLSPVREHATVGAMVYDSLQAEVAPALRRQLAKEIATALGEPGDDPATVIDGWAAAEFFARHVALTDRSPEVWHLSSRDGSFQVLVHATMCTREQIDLLRTGLLREHIDSLNRRLRSAHRAGRADETREIDDAIRESRRFDIVLGWLHEGTNAQARIRYPWRDARAQPQGWAPDFEEGMRPNIAPLQRLGLLPVAVLTVEELQVLAPTE